MPGARHQRKNGRGRNEIARALLHDQFAALPQPSISQRRVARPAAMRDGVG
jgi:hypothetical protein